MSFCISQLLFNTIVECLFSIKIFFLLLFVLIQQFSSKDFAWHLNTRFKIKTYKNEKCIDFERENIQTYKHMYVINLNSYDFCVKPNFKKYVMNVLSRNIL